MTVTVGAANMASAVKQSVQVIPAHGAVKGPCHGACSPEPAVLLSAAMQLLQPTRKQAFGCMTRG